MESAISDMFRRIYQYCVALISLETIVWGTIESARLALALRAPGGNLTSLASWLSLALVSLPIFIIHWRLIQRDLRQNAEERASLSRALFLYAILLANLAGSLIFGLALFSQLFLVGFGLSSDLAAIAGQRSLAGNLVATLINLLAAGLFYRVVQSDWQALTGDSEYAPGEEIEHLQVRRIFRYGWWLISLGLTVLGIHSVLQVILKAWQPLNDFSKSILANGLAFMLAGSPIFITTSIVIRRSMVEGREKKSLLLLSALYALTFTGVVGTLLSAQQILNKLLRFALAGEFAPAQILSSLAAWIALAVPMGITWFYYGRRLREEFQRRAEVQPDYKTRRVSLTNRFDLRNRIRQDSLRRLYNYTLSLLGLGTAALGLHALLAYLVNLGAGEEWLCDEMRINLAFAISALATGLPVWIIQWRTIQHRATQDTELGEHARRSLIRQAYLYLAMTVGIVGGMFTSGMILFMLLDVILGKTAPGFLVRLLLEVKTAVIYWALLIYHLVIIRADQRMTGKALARRYAQFPVLILAPEIDENETARDFAEEMVRALQHRAPNMPVAVHRYNQGAPDETLSLAQAVILPADLLAASLGSRPLEAIRLWLQNYQGVRLVVSGLQPAPITGQNWQWVATRHASLAEMARRAAQMTCRLAEEE